MKNYLPLAFLLIPFITAAQVGFIDSTFGSNGIVFPSDGLFKGRMESYDAMTLQPDGKILLAGVAWNSEPPYSDVAVMRLRANGQRDPFFGDGGLVRSDVDNGFQTGRGIALQPDGKILVVSVSDSESPSNLFRYLPNGDPDLSFGNNGRAAMPLVGFPTYNYNNHNALALQADGKIIVSGSVNNSTQGAFFMYRFLPDGSMDASFGDNGLVIADVTPGDEYCSDMFIQPDGKIVLAGYTEPNTYNPRFTLMRFWPSGDFDPDFGDGAGYVITEVPGYIDCYAYSAKLQPDGKIVTIGAGLYGLAPTIIDNIITRHNPDGTPDTSFGNGGISIVYFDNILECWSTNLDIQADGKLLVNGYCRTGFDQDLAVYRYWPDGAIDTSFGLGGYNFIDLGSYSDQSFTCLISGDRLLVAANRSEEYWTVLAYQLEASTATSEPSPARLMQVFPNPVSRQTVTLSLDLIRPAEIRVVLYDLQGRPAGVLWSGEWPSGPLEKALSLPPALPEGLYFLAIEGENWTNTVKLSVGNQRR